MMEEQGLLQAVEATSGPLVPHPERSPGKCTDDL